MKRMIVCMLVVCLCMSVGSCGNEGDGIIQSETMYDTSNDLKPFDVDKNDVKTMLDLLQSDESTGIDFEVTFDDSESLVIVDKNSGMILSYFLDDNENINMGHVTCKDQEYFRIGVSWLRISLGDISDYGEFSDGLNLEDLDNFETSREYSTNGNFYYLTHSQNYSLMITKK